MALKYANQVIIVTLQVRPKGCIKRKLRVRKSRPDSKACSSKTTGQNMLDNPGFQVGYDIHEPDPSYTDDIWNASKW